MPEDDPSFPDDPGRGLVFVWAPPTAPLRVGKAFITLDRDDGDPILETLEGEHSIIDNMEPQTPEDWVNTAAWMLVGAVIVGAALVLMAMTIAVWGGVMRVTWVTSRAEVGGPGWAVGKGRERHGGAESEAELSPLVISTRP